MPRISQLSMKFFLWDLLFQREIAKQHVILAKRLRKWQGLYKGVAKNSFLSMLLLPFLRDSRFLPNSLAILLLQHSRERILDIGCGTGSLSSFLARHGTEVIATDISRSYLAESMNAARQLKRQFSADVHYVRADAQNLPLRDGSVSSVISVSVLEHIPNETQTATEAERVLEEHGAFIVTIPFSIFPKETIHVFYGVRERWYTHKMIDERIIAPSGLRLEQAIFMDLHLPETSRVFMIERTPYTRLLLAPFHRISKKPNMNSIGAALKLVKD